MKKFLIGIFVLFCIFSLLSCDDKAISKKANAQSSDLVDVILKGTTQKETKGLAVDDSISIADYIYKAIPQFESLNDKPVPGTQSEYKILGRDGKLQLASGLWKIELAGRDNTGNIIFEGSKEVSISKNNPSELSVYVTSVVPEGKGTLKINLDESYKLKLDYKNLKDFSGKVEDFDFVKGNPKTFELNTGTYLITLTKEYQEKDNQNFTNTVTKGLTVIAKINKDHITTITGTIEDFRNMGTMYLTLPTVLNNAPYKAYDYFTFAELKQYANYNGTFISSYLDGTRFEDALYTVPEGQPGTAISSIGKAEGVQLYGHRKKYALSWDYAGENVTADTTSMTPAGSYYWNEDITAPSLTRTGYNQTGWTPSFTTHMPAENVCYKPIWLPKTIKVIYDYDGATSGNTVAYKEVTYNSTYGVLPEPLRTAYTFVDWKYNDTVVTSQTSLLTDTDHTIKAAWEKNSYKVVFNLNIPSDSVGTAPVKPSDQIVEYGNRVSISALANTTNYLFDGWYTEKTEGSQITNGTILYPDKVGVEYNLYAHWKDARCYSITWNSNGAETNASGTTNKVYYGDKFIMPTKNPSYTLLGTFKGWFTQQEGGEQITADTIAQPTGVNVPLTLYAQFEFFTEVADLTLLGLSKENIGTENLVSDGKGTIIYYNGSFNEINNVYYISTDNGTTWKQVEIPTAAFPNTNRYFSIGSIHYANNRWVMIGSSQYSNSKCLGNPYLANRVIIAVSSDGENWTSKFCQEFTATSFCTGLPAAGYFRHPEPSNHKIIHYYWSDRHTWKAYISDDVEGLTYEYKSVDNGETWSFVNNGWLGSDPQNKIYTFNDTDAGIGYTRINSSGKTDFIDVDSIVMILSGKTGVPKVCGSPKSIVLSFADCIYEYNGGGEYRTEYMNNLIAGYTPFYYENGSNKYWLFHSSDGKIYYKKNDSQGAILSSDYYGIESLFYTCINYKHDVFDTEWVKGTGKTVLGVSGGKVYRVTFNI